MSEWITGGAGVLSSTIGAISGAAQQKQQIKFQTAANEQNRRDTDRRRAEDRAYALEDWEREAEYNSASAQRKRLEEAGLSASLMSGGTPTSAPSTKSAEGSPGTAEAPDLGPSPFAQIGDDLRNTVALMADVELKNAQRNESDSRAGLNIENAEIARLDARYRAETLQNQIALSTMTLFETRTKIKQAYKAMDKTDAEIFKIYNDAWLDDQKFQEMLRATSFQEDLQTKSFEHGVEKDNAYLSIYRKLSESALRADATEDEIKQYNHSMAKQADEFVAYLSRDYAGGNALTEAHLPKSVADALALEIGKAADLQRRSQTVQEAQQRSRALLTLLGIVATAGVASAKGLSSGGKTPPPSSPPPRVDGRYGL